CFFLYTEVPRPLEPEQRSQLTDALRKTLHAAPGWVADDRKHREACEAEIDPDQPNLITGCELARELAEQLAGTKLADLKVISGGHEVSLIEAFEEIATEQDIFRELLTEAMIAAKAGGNAKELGEQAVKE